MIWSFVCPDLGCAGWWDFVRLSEAVSKYFYQTSFFHVCNLDQIGTQILFKVKARVDKG